jgi:hypothetical protein
MGEEYISHMKREIYAGCLELHAKKCDRSKWWIWAIFSFMNFIKVFYMIGAPFVENYVRTMWDIGDQDGDGSERRQGTETKILLHFDLE